MHLFQSCQKKGYRILVISGLAYGIDIHAHKAALHMGLPTVAVLGHGLETIYPSLHDKIANDMLAHEGGLVSDFMSFSPNRPQEFPATQPYHCRFVGCNYYCGIGKEGRSTGNGRNCLLLQPGCFCFSRKKGGYFFRRM